MLWPQTAPVSSVRGGQWWPYMGVVYPALLWSEARPQFVWLTSFLEQPFCPADWAVVTITAGLFTFSQRLFPAEPSLTAAITQDELVPLIAIARSFKRPPNFSSWNCTVVWISQLSGCNYRVMFDIRFCFESREKRYFHGVWRFTHSAGFGEIKIWGKNGENPFAACFHQSDQWE